MKKIFLAGVAALLMATSAHAAYDECAVVLKTPDGFLALREEPTVRSKIIYKLQRGEALIINKSRLRWKKFAKEWMFVTTNIEVAKGSGPGDDYQGYLDGFVLKKYIQQFRCSDAGLGDPGGLSPITPEELPRIELK